MLSPSPHKAMEIRQDLCFLGFMWIVLGLYYLICLSAGMLSSLFLALQELLDSCESRGFHGSLQYLIV